MIQRLRKVDKNFYRGSAPSPQEVAWLKNNLGIERIVSLDSEAANRISKTCKLLNIEQIVLPLETPIKKDLIRFLSYDLKKLVGDKKTYVHCAQGKDRTGFVAALYQCKYLNKNPEEAINEAKNLGFGKGVTFGYHPIIKLFEKLIRHCKPVTTDTNNADVVSNERDYRSDNLDTFLDEATRSSFSPYLAVTKQYPYDAEHNYIQQQSQTRENYYKDVPKAMEENVVPLVGIYDTDAGVSGMGASENIGHLFFD